MMESAAEANRTERNRACWLPLVFCLSCLIGLHCAGIIHE
jgi:hypothetical protein